MQTDTTSSPADLFTNKRKTEKSFLLKFHTEIDQGRFPNSIFYLVLNIIYVGDFWYHNGLEHNKDLMRSQNGCLLLS